MTLSYILLIEVCFSLSAVQSCLVIGRRGCLLSCCSWEALVDHRPDQAAIVPFFLSCSPRCTLDDTLHGHFLCRARAPAQRALSRIRDRTRILVLLSRSLASDPSGFNRTAPFDIRQPIDRPIGRGRVVAYLSSEQRHSKNSVFTTSFGAEDEVRKGSLL